MKIFTIIVWACALCAASALFYSYMHELIIIRYPLAVADSTPLQHAPATKKNVKLIYWDKGSWHTEHSTLMWSNNKADNALYVINSWLTMLYEEKIMNKKITLQTALLSATDTTLYISFDRNPLPSECPTIKKLYWIQGLVRSLQENNVLFQSIQFLVNHQPLNDEHLDFSNSWPIAGFFKQ